METKSNNPVEQVTFYEGRPIEHFDEDQLGRKHFARFFAETITRHHGRESLVLAVNGPWGEGKTSFKNMVVDLLEQEHSQKIVTLAFTPWEWASQNQVSGAFFAEIAKQLELKDSSQEAKNAAERFFTLGRYLGLAGKLVGPTGLFLEPVLPGSTIITAALGKGLGKALDLARDAAEEMEKAAEQAKLSLPGIKSGLRTALQKYFDERKKLILVVVDDIDRLTPEEIRLVFQMVRVNGDFPAMVFLLLYDEEFVVRALQEYFKEDSRRFLEKIVQFQVGLPVLVDNRLRDHVAEEMAKIFSTRPAYEYLFSLERFQSIWALGAGAYVNNLRRAGRLLSSFEFHLGAFRSDEAEVNPLDFFVLEIFRLFEPALYQLLYQDGDRLFPTVDDLVVWELHKRRDNEVREDVWEKRLGEFVDKVSATTKEAAGQLLKELFPKPGVGRGFYGSDTEEAARARRLNHLLYFNRYFRLTIDAWDIPEARISQLEASMARPEEFVNSLKLLNQEGKLALALTKFLARDKLKPSVDPVGMICALCKFGDEFENIEHQKNLLDPRESLRSLVQLQLPSELSSTERLSRILKGIEGSKATHFPIELAESEDRTEHQFAEADANERRTIGPHLERADVDKLNAYVAEELEKAIKSKSEKISTAWIRSIGWHLNFMEARTNQKADSLLSTPILVAVVLCVVINEQSFKEYKNGRAHFAATPMYFAKNRFGFDRFDKAIEVHEGELRKISDEVSKRIEIYRDMRKRFSHLADPNPVNPETILAED